MVRLDRNLSGEDYNMITKYYVDDRRKCCSTSTYTRMDFNRNLSGENYYIIKMLRFDRVLSRKIIIVDLLQVNKVRLDRSLSEED